MFVVIAITSVATVFLLPRFINRLLSIPAAPYPTSLTLPPYLVCYVITVKSSISRQPWCCERSWIYTQESGTICLALTTSLPLVEIVSGRREVNKHLSSYKLCATLPISRTDPPLSFPRRKILTSAIRELTRIDEGPFLNGCKTSCGRHFVIIIASY